MRDYFKRKAWTKEEEDYLIANCDKTTSLKLAQIFDVTSNCIRKKCGELGLSFNRDITSNRWRKEEDDFLKENFIILNYDEMSENLKRTRMATIHRCRFLGLFRAERHHVQPGEKYGRLTVLSKTNKSDTGRCTYFLCRCECGTTREIRGSSLQCGNTKSCGCLVAELSSERGSTYRGLAGQPSYKALESGCKNAATSRDLEYKLTTEQFIYLIGQNCYWDGEPPRDYNVYTKKDGSKSSSHSHIKDEWVSQQWIKANGIDRLDSSLGYTIENCVPCCFPCNQRKMDTPPEEFLEHMRKILDYQANKVKKNVAS
jgi:hypothetical protein